MSEGIYHRCCRAEAEVARLAALVEEARTALVLAETVALAAGAPHLLKLVTAVLLKMEKLSLAAPGEMQ